MFLIFDSNEEETRVESNATERNKGQSEKCQVNKFLNQDSFVACTLHCDLVLIFCHFNFR